MSADCLTASIPAYVSRDGQGLHRKYAQLHVEQLLARHGHRPGEREYHGRQRGGPRQGVRRLRGQAQGGGRCRSVHSR